MAGILVVEDEQVVRGFLGELLMADGHQVATVDSGEAALELIATCEFDLVLLDLHLKGVSGMEVLRELRRRSKDAAVIILTGHASVETAVEALRQGADDYLFKPATPEEIEASIREALLKRERDMRRQATLERLQSHLARSLDELREATESVLGAVPAGSPLEQQPKGKSAPEMRNGRRFLSCGALVMDLLRHTVTLGGRLLVLTPTEFAVLAYLTGQYPRVVPAQELVRQVQNHECDAWEARDLMRRYVSSIRQKAAEATGRADIIRTVRGVGYAIIARTA